MYLKKILKKGSYTTNKDDTDGGLFECISSKGLTVANKVSI